MNEPRIRRFGALHPIHPLAAQAIVALSGLGVTATLEPSDGRGVLLEVELPSGQRILIGAPDDIPTADEPLICWAANCVSADTEFLDDVYTADDPDPAPLAAAVAAYLEAHQDRRPVPTRTVRVRAKKTYAVDVEVPVVLGGDAVDGWLAARHHLWCPEEYERFGYEGEELEGWSEADVERDEPAAETAGSGSWQHTGLTAAIWSKVPGSLGGLHPGVYERLERAISHSTVPEALLDVVSAVLGTQSPEDSAD